MAKAYKEIWRGNTANAELCSLMMMTFPERILRLRGAERRRWVLTSLSSLRRLSSTPREDPMASRDKYVYINTPQLLSHRGLFPRERRWVNLPGVGNHKDRLTSE